MIKIAIAYHSGYGHTKKLAEAVMVGVKNAGATVDLIEVNKLNEQSWTKLHAANAIIFGSPTYMGSVSAEFKKFADETSEFWLAQKWKDKIAAGFTNSSSINGDKFSCIQYLWTLSQQHSMIWVSLGLLPSNKKDAHRNDINYMGCFSGLGAQSPSDASSEEGLLSGDEETAKLFGQRIVDITKRFFPSTS